MRCRWLGILVLISITGSVIGCGEKPATAPAMQASGPAENAAAATDDPKIAKALAELSEEDRAVAAAQKFCAIEHNNRLGSMGKPHKVMVEGQPVFLCCAGCEEEALKHPQATLAISEKLKAANRNN